MGISACHDACKARYCRRYPLLPIGESGYPERQINYELVVVVTDAELAAQARADFEEDLKQSVRTSTWRVEETARYRKLKDDSASVCSQRADNNFRTDGDGQKDEVAYPLVRGA